jgi:hypothetical protein
MPLAPDHQEPGTGSITGPSSHASPRGATAHRNRAGTLPHPADPGKRRPDAQVQPSSQQRASPGPHLAQGHLPCPANRSAGYCTLNGALPQAARRRAQQPITFRRQTPGPRRAIPPTCVLTFSQLVDAPTSSTRSSRLRGRSISCPSPRAGLAGCGPAGRWRPPGRIVPMSSGLTRLAGPGRRWSAAAARPGRGSQVCRAG